MSDRISRRDALKLGGAGLLGATLIQSGCATSPATRASAAMPGNTRTRVCRVAHMTDIHVEPELRAGEGMAAAFAHVAALDDKPDIVITGGDMVMDSMDQDHERTKVQWDLWNRVMNDGCPYPRRSCIGNHDVWGWNKSKSRTTGSEAKWGKGWALDAMKMDARYSAFDLPTRQPGRSWRCIILDSIQPHEQGYTGNLDEAQMDWLTRELRDSRKDQNIVIVSHIPILSACVFFDTKIDAPRNMDVVGGLMHSDAAELKRLFGQHPNVKACLSGHIHQIDRVEFNGVTYLCNGAVSGAWWKGRHVDCDEGYALVDLYDDGSVERRYVTYGWEAKA
jgi:3',5'-cyclic AMP phosphodiesterase CpdA